MLHATHDTPGAIPHAILRFHGDLNDFLPKELRSQALPYPLTGPTSVKHAIEALGAPHPEVELITVDGAAAGFDVLLAAGHCVHIYPLGHPAAQQLPFALRPPLPRPVRFVADTHLGRLAAYLRLLGCDTLYRNDTDDAELAALAGEQNRVLLTRDRGLLKRKQVVYGYCLRDTDSRRQLVGVLRRYRPARAAQRCTHCNGVLEAVEKAAVFDRLEPKTKLYYEEFQRCAVCGQVYWQGSHYERIEAFLSGVLAEVEG